MKLPVANQKLDSNKNVTGNYFPLTLYVYLPGDLLFPMSIGRSRPMYFLWPNELQRN